MLALHVQLHEAWVELAGAPVGSRAKSMRVCWRVPTNPRTARRHRGKTGAMAQRTVDVDLLREHLAYEVHYLVLAARRFPEMAGREAAIYQDSAVLHSRNLLEFTNPMQRVKHSIWIGDVGGNKPQMETLYRDWMDFINARVTHLGPDRMRGGNEWPDTDVQQLAKYALKRIKDSLPQGNNEMHVTVINELAELGLAYLDSHDESKLDQIADALNNPMPIQTPDAQ
jgi:hypothetical protein